MTIGRSVSFITLGCAKNEVDSENMARRLEASGYAIVEDPENCDVVIVNTCSFIQAATEESIEAVLEVAGFESVLSKRTRLVLAGCMSSRYGSDLESELPEVSAFVPCADEGSIVEIVDKVLDISRGDNAQAPSSCGDPQESVSCYVKISDGCDRFCSYCTIPFIRGRYHSFSVQDIDDEIASHVRSGAREVVLIAQDTGRWGDDFETPATLADLVSHVAEQWPETWFRIMYIQPEGVTDALIDVIATHDNVCSYFDIPFQHANRRILAAMNRKGSSDDFLDLLARIRNRIPDATLRTTLIVGFPGESDDDFDELCEFVEEADLDYIGVFTYSREEGTRADSLDGHIDEDEKLARAQKLRDLADDVCAPMVSRRIGKDLDVLVCGYEEDGQLYGRAMCQAPDVDGVTYLDAGIPGEIVKAHIEDTLLYEMEGTVVSR